MRMLLRNANELIQSRQNYGTVVYPIFRGENRVLSESINSSALEFLELEQCIDCIKEKFAKKIKNHRKRWINSRYLK